MAPAMANKIDAGRGTRDSAPRLSKDGESRSNKGEAWILIIFYPIGRPSHDSSEHGKMVRGTMEHGMPVNGKLAHGNLFRQAVFFFPLP